MATVNQSPAGQPSVTLVGIDFNNIGFSEPDPVWQSKKLVGSPSVTLVGIDFNNIGFSEPDPVWQSKKLVGSPSVEISFCPGGSGPSVPTVGQIFPLFG